MSNVWRAWKETKPFIIVLLFYAISFCYAMFQGGFGSWFIFFTITPFVLYALLLQIVPMSFRRVTRALTPTMLAAGDAATVCVTFERSNRFPLFFMALEDDVQHEYVRNRRALQLGGFRKTFTWTFTHSELARGEYTFQALHIKCYDLLGWGTRTFTVEAPQSFLVYPRIEHIKRAPIETQMERGATQSRYAVVKDTSMVTSVRNYQPGDRMSWIHWKSFAKTEQLRTKDFEDKQSQHVLIVADLQRGQQFEAAVSLSASLVQTFVKQQSDVVFMTLGDQRRAFPVIQTSSQMQEVLRHLALVRPETNMQEHALLQEPLLQQACALLVVMSAFSDEQKQRLLQLAKPIICLVVTDEPKQQEHFQQLRIIYVHPESFEHVLVEVAKR